MPKRNTTSYQETAFGILPHFKIVALEKEGVVKAQQYILRLSKSKVNITPELICRVHKEGFHFIFPVWAGEFRKVNVKVGSYDPPHFDQVSQLVKSLCDDLSERSKYLSSENNNEERFLDEVIPLLAWFQHRIVWIHPFKDYNGRIARLLTNLLALNLNLPIISIRAETGRDRKRYIEAMKAADNHDYSKLEDLIAEALEESLGKL